MLGTGMGGMAIRGIWPARCVGEARHEYLFDSLCGAAIGWMRLTEVRASEGDREWRKKLTQGLSANRRYRLDKWNVLKEWATVGEWQRSS